MKNNKILVVDDDRDTLDLLQEFLTERYDVTTAQSAEEALAALDKQHFNIAITDLVMPKQSGLELMQNIRKNWPYVSIIVISGQATIQHAVKAMKLGAEEFILKPISNLELLTVLIDKILDKQWLVQENKRLNSMLKNKTSSKPIIGTSAVMQNIFKMIQKIAPLDTTMLITGETGVGKNMIAQLIHDNSPRKNNRFVTVNCGSIPETLLESHLFGHEKGAFTDAVRSKQGYFQEADNGTLFLDEITETSPSFQVKLLRVIENKIIRKVGGENDINVNVRLIVATNKDIKSLVKKGTFREDLYYRLNIINLFIPPLRKRKEDIEVFAKHFLEEFKYKYQKLDLKISPPALSILKSAEWPGNVRELRNAIERAVILAEYSAILPQDLPNNLYKAEQTTNSNFNMLAKMDFRNAKQEFEKKYLQAVLEQCDGNITKAS
ncbi:MAG: sigma-54 dependent transcriptional regulator [Candidatus Cloacimonadota bacterium]|nr:sigma-54 dependent transcriptional regulator [Candidatus Cloacimonadota bacterium]